MGKGWTGGSPRCHAGGSKETEERRQRRERNAGEENLFGQPHATTEHASAMLWHGTGKLIAKGLELLCHFLLSISSGNYLAGTLAELETHSRQMLELTWCLPCGVPLFQKTWPRGREAKEETKKKKTKKH